MKDADILNFIEAIKTNVTIEIHAALLVHIAQVLKDKHVETCDSIEVLKRSGANTSEMEMSRDANEVVAVEIMAILAKQFGMEFVKMAIGGKADIRSNNSKPNKRNNKLH